jgi:hypothetical protein
MIERIINSLLMKEILVVVLVAHLLACGGGGGSSETVSGGSVEGVSVESVNNGVSDIAEDVVVSGSVGDGPVTGATIEVWNSNGKMLGTLNSDSNASFSRTLKVKRSEYPLLLKVRGGVDLVTGRAPDFQMVSVMRTRWDQQVNINPFTTLAVKIAKLLPGGMTTSNISTAQAIVTEKLGFGLDLKLVADPITAAVTDTNVASLVKASEACGEMVRRTRDLVSRAGSPVSGNAVIAAIAADMTDGFLDGRGKTGTVPAIAAVANVVSAQVLVEALSNSLKVGGVVATGVIDQSIKTTRPRVSSSQLTNSVRVTQNMLGRAKVSLAAAQVLDSSFEVVSLAKTVSGIAAGDLPAKVATVLPADSSRSLDNAVLLSSTASAADISRVNQVVKSEGGSNKTGTGTTSSGTVNPGATAPANGNLALSRPVMVSSVQFGGVEGKYAVDGNASTRWSSKYSDPQWIYVDMGATYTIERVVLNWEAAYAKRYDIQVSADARNWKTVFTEGNGNGGIDDVRISPVSARYVRMLGLQRGTQWGYSLWEIGVYGAGGAVVTSGGTTGSGTSSSSTSTSSTSTSSTSSNSTTGSNTATSGSATGSGTTAPVTNTAPVIRGTPVGTVVAGSAYSFRPSASDADGDALKFSITNKPVWASFSTTTGQLSGTPANADARTYSNIVIAVSDGKKSVSLPAFSITVTAAQKAPLGGFSLSWSAPTTRADGTPLSLADIDGYRIYLGKSPGNYSDVVEVADGTAQSANVTDLPAGTYYLVMTTFDNTGLESQKSAEVSKAAR